MSIRDKIRKLVAQAVESYDFTDVIEEAIDDIDIDGIVFDCFNDRMKKVDLTRLIEGTIRDIVEEELDDVDIESLLCDELDEI